MFATFPPQLQPVQLKHTAQYQRNRLTCLFRLILVIPHYIAVYIVNIAVSLVVFAGWFVALFLGYLPDGFKRFITSFLRFYTRFLAYTYLLTDQYPPFEWPQGHPRSAIPRPLAPPDSTEDIDTPPSGIPAVPVPVDLWNIQLDPLDLSEPTTKKRPMAPVVSPPADQGETIAPNDWHAPPISGPIYGYPFDLDIPDMDRLNRLAILFRIVLMIPASLLSGLVNIGLLPFNIVAWASAVILGRSPKPIYDAQMSIIRYTMRFTSYAYLVTPIYPSGLWGDTDIDDVDAIELASSSKTIITISTILGVLFMVAYTVFIVTFIG